MYSQSLRSSLSASSLVPQVNSIYMDETEVTYEAFAAFAEETGHQTVAEHFNNSMIFGKQITESLRKANDFQPVPSIPWWLFAYGVTWKQPNGPGSSWKGILFHISLT